VSVCAYVGFAGKGPEPLLVEVDHLVIGLGLAGSELATLLARDHKEFLALEARATFGGRAQNIQFGDYRVPKGGAWQQGGGKQHALTDRLKSCGIKTTRQNWNRWADYNYTGSSISASWSNFEAAYACADALSLEMQARGDPDTDQQALLLACGWFKASVADHLPELSTLEFEWAEPATATSAFSSMPWATYTSPHTDEDNFIIDPRGMEELAGCWLDRYVQGGRHGASLQYNSPVVSVNTDLKVVTLQNGSRIGWRHALFDTRSLAIHQYDAAKNGGQGFVPRIDGLRLQGILNMHYPVFEKIFLQFPRKFWGNLEIYNIFSSSGRSGSMWQNLDVPGFFRNSRILYHTLASPDSQRFELLSDAQIVANIRVDLESVFGAGNVPDPERVFVSRWTSDPFFRGSYSNRPPSLDNHRYDAIFIPFGANETVMLTGEAYCQRMNGYLHSAILAAQTTYDEWKIRRGEVPIVRSTPRNNVCFSAQPTAKRDILSKGGVRYNRFDRAQDRQPDESFWQAVGQRLQKARVSLELVGK